MTDSGEIIKDPALVTVIVLQPCLETSFPMKLDRAFVTTSLDQFFPGFLNSVLRLFDIIFRMLNRFIDTKDVMVQIFHLSRSQTGFETPNTSEQRLVTHTAHVARVILGPGQNPDRLRKRNALSPGQGATVFEKSFKPVSETAHNERLPGQSS